MKTKLRNNKEARSVKERDRAYSKMKGKCWWETLHPEFISKNFHRKTNKK